MYYHNPIYLSTVTLHRQLLLKIPKMFTLVKINSYKYRKIVLVLGGAHPHKKNKQPKNQKNQGLSQVEKGLLRKRH